MKNIGRAIAFVALVLFFAAPAVFVEGFSADSRSQDTSYMSGCAAFVRTGNVVSQAQVTPDEYYHSVWKHIDDNFLYRERLTDWQKWEHKYDGKLSNFADAEKAINEMLDSLGDRYTYFKNQTVTKADTDKSDETNVVSYKLLPGNIGYIKIKTFGSNHTADEVKAALKALSGADAYVLDLRENYGGYIKEAFGVFALFVDSGTFTSLRGQYDGKAYLQVLSLTAKEMVDSENGSDTKSSRDENMTGRKPVVVLVNGDTASASEMLSGALRDNGRAELVGVKTYGKGVAQITKNLPRNTSLRITFARYYLPKGASIHGPGITPDHVVKPSGSGDAQLDSATSLLKTKLGR